MSGVSLPVNRPIGRALVVGAASARAHPAEVLRRHYGFECAEADDPYAAVLELCRRKTVYNAIILSLSSLYREELGVIATVKRRFPHLEVWLTHTDGRQAALAEAMRLGADGLLGDDGLHRIAPMAAPSVSEPAVQLYTGPAEPVAGETGTAAPGPHEPRPGDETPIGEPVLSADELRALLQEQPSMPPSGSESSGG